MKKIFVRLMSISALATMLFICSCSHERLKVRPDKIISTTVDPAVFQKIVQQFPEHQNVKTSQKALFESSAQKEVVLTNESEVYVTYISEGASFENTFGWYSYNASSKPTKTSDLQLHVLYPTVSDQILKQGDMLQLGDSKFPAGTVIGFFLIIKGWENGTVHYDRQTFYTDINLNQDGQQQHILFKQKDLNQIVLAFEDELTSGVSDMDYNDIIFTVTDNKNGQDVTNLNLTNVVQL